MEKILKFSKKNNYQINYNIESITTPIKINPNKYKENILNSFLQEKQSQKKPINKYSIPVSPKSKTNKNKESDSIEYNQIIERKGKYSNNYNQKNEKKKNIKNYSPNIVLSAHKSQNKNSKKENNRNYKILNPFKERSSSSSKSILIPTNENQISIVKNVECFNLTKIKNNNKDNNNNHSFILDSSDKKKLKRNNTVYIKKNLSRDKYLKNKYNGDYLNKTKNKENYIEDNNYKLNKKNIPRANSSAMSKKTEKEEPSTHNVNSNVNIFNFDMKYNNSPNYFIKNSKLYNPYFNNYLPNNLRNENNYNNIKPISNQNLKNNYKETYNNSFSIEEKDIDNNKMEEQIFEQSAIIIQSVYRGCLIRFQINNLLKAYKAVDVLSHFFKSYFWKFFKNNIIMKSNILNNEIDSKMSISSISCLSALFNNNNNKNYIFKSFNSKSFKEVHESFFILNPSNNSNNFKYLDTFQDINNIYSINNININNNDNNKSNKALVWNKKIISKNNIPKRPSSKNIKIIKNDDNKKDVSISNIKIKCLKIIVTKYLNNSKINLLKYFMKFYFNGFICKNKDNINYNTNNDSLKKQKLIKIIENRELNNRKILNKYLYKFNFKGILNFMENNWYYMNNGGRLYDIGQNTFFIYESKIFENGNNILNHNDDENRNIGIKLCKIRILKKILFQKRKLTKEKIKIYFYKFHFYGIICYMRKEISKKIISKNLFLLDNNNKNNILKEEQIKNQKRKLLRNIINRNTKICNNACKNIFDKWNLRTKIFSMIAIDKEKKKKRRIKKRNNKKLSLNSFNNPNNNNNNININNNSPNNNNIINNTNKKINNTPNKSYCPINLKKQDNEIIKTYFIEHSNSVIFSNKIKITDYNQLNKFIDKINSVLSKKFFFFHIILNKCSDKNKNINANIEEKKEEKNNINEEIDFFLEDSSENSEDN